MFINVFFFGVIVYYHKKYIINEYRKCIEKYYKNNISLLKLAYRKKNALYENYGKNHSGISKNKAFIFI